MCTFLNSYTAAIHLYFHFHYIRDDAVSCHHIIGFLTKETIFDEKNLFNNI